MALPPNPAVQNALAAARPGGNIANFVRGPMASPVAGRTDHLPVSASQGSYVIPADVVSALGQGNTQSGYAVLMRMFPHSARPDTPPAGPPVNIMAAGGEFVVVPQDVAAYGNGNLEVGHRALDAWVKKVRTQYRTALGKIPGPKR